MSVISRLWRIGKAYIQSHPEALEKELKAWEEKIRKQEKIKNDQQRTTQKSGVEDIADAFRALEVEVGADFETCHRAYWHLAKKYHPDQWQDPEKQEIASKLFQLINEAYARIKQYYQQT